VGRGGKNNLYTTVQKYWHLSKALGGPNSRSVRRNFMLKMAVFNHKEGNWWLKFAPLNIAQNCMG
jgi:hypothetical protein